MLESVQIGQKAFSGEGAPVRATALPCSPWRPFTAVVATATLAAIVVTTGGFSAAASSRATLTGSDAVQLEVLDRGLVAVTGPEGIHLSWRLLGGEVTGATAASQTSAPFHVYRDGVRIATVSDTTTYVDPSGTPTSRYQVDLVGAKGRAGHRSATVTPSTTDYLDIPLNKPADGVTPAGEAYTYSANDASVADLDGDGALEYVVKWDPSNNKDVSQIGYTGPVYLDAYGLDGTQLWRIDMGVNIRAGAHYTQLPVYDFDGDGKAELMMKTAPGTKITTYRKDGRVKSQRYVTVAARDRAAGVTTSSDFRLSKAGYYEHLVALFQSWSSRPEVTSGQWPATLEQAFGIAPTHTYPLSEAAARELANYFIDVYAPSRSPRNQLRSFEGFIVDGPEYLTVFDGSSGKELATVDYEPGRTDDGLLWGDYAMARIEPANRVDRFLSGVAYLDGARPSAIFARGYYTRSTLAAYDWNGRSLTKRWFVDSGWTPMTNPFNDSPHGRDGTDPVFGSITTQGHHSLSAADVDGDGRHEVVYGAATIDDDGSLLYSSKAVLPPGSAAPGTMARLGHGDALHVTDIDPDRPGLEIFTAHENATMAPYGMVLRDAATGSPIFGVYSGKDTGRAMIGDVLPGQRGLEGWASLPGGSDSLGLYSAAGVLTPGAIPGTNQSVKWLGDGTTQILDGSGATTPKIVDWTRGVQRTLDGTLANNGTKGNASLIADVLGDWREEVLMRTVDSRALRLFVSTSPTNRKQATLLHDPQYRAEVARQQTTYNQPSYPGYYLASDTDYRTVPVFRP